MFSLTKAFFKKVNYIISKTFSNENEFSVATPT